MSKKRDLTDQLIDLDEQSTLDARLDELTEAKKASRRQDTAAAAAGRWLGSAFSAAKGLISSPRFRKGGASVMLTVLFVAFVVLSNLVAVKLTERYAFLSPDMTQNKIYTLSDVSLDLLDQLDEHVEIDIIAPESLCKNPDITTDPYGHIPLACELIERYAQHSENVKVFYIDLTQNPGYLDLVPEHRDSIFTYSIVVRSEKRSGLTSFYEMLPSLSSTAYTDSSSVDIAASLTETYISSLIKTVSLDTVPVVAYLDTLGGGEYTTNLLDALALNGYSILTSEHFAFGYEDIPDEVQMAVIGAPEYDLTLTQLESLADFLYNDGNYGKSLLVLTTPYMQQMPNLSSLLSEWGMNLQRATVYEGDSSLVLPLQTADNFKATYMNSEYIDDAISVNDTVVSGALSIDIPYQTLGNVVINGILCTSSSGFVSDVSEVFDASNYTAADGAVRCIMAQATLYGDSGTGTTLRSDIIVAPVSLCADNYFGANLVYSNFPLMMGLCNDRCGLAGQNLDIASKTLTAVDFSVDSGSLVIINVIFSYIVPLLVAAVGVIVCVRRRRL